MLPRSPTLWMRTARSILFLDSRTYSHIEKWQRIVKTLSVHTLTSSSITRLSQSITELNRMDLFRLRAKRMDKGAVKKATLTSGFFASKTLGLDLDPMEARSRYGMRDEQEKTFMLQKGPLGEDRLRVCTESSKHGRMFICFVALILASYIRHIRDSKPELAKTFPSMSAILEEMQTIRCIEHDGRRKFVTPFVGDQLLICDAFGFEVPEGCRPTYTSKKSTKGKRGRPPKPQTETS